MFGLPHFRSHLKSRSFAIQLLFDHTKSGLVQILYPRCPSLLEWIIPIKLVILFLFYNISNTSKNSSFQFNSGKLQINSLYSHCKYSTQNSQFRCYVIQNIFSAVYSWNWFNVYFYSWRFLRSASTVSHMCADQSSLSSNGCDSPGEHHDIFSIRTDHCLSFPDGPDLNTNRNYPF